ncbi:hypothetical protein BH10BAC3_BH10BAC3_29640 [soil metagenome]
MLFKKYWIYCFLFLLLADAFALSVQSKEAHFILKLFLMPVLIIGLLHNKRHVVEKNWRLILAGLVTAWAGDVMLLFSEHQELFFIIGLVCFLCTHLAYIVYFSRYNQSIFNFLKMHLLLAALVILYAILLVLFLRNGLGALLIPVIVYTIVITVMVLQSMAARQFLASETGNKFVAGAIAFIISDSLLAIAKFSKPFFLSEPAIIITYGIAQLLIVQGVIKNTDKKLLTPIKM